MSAQDPFESLRQFAAKAASDAIISSGLKARLDEFSKVAIEAITPEMAAANKRMNKALEQALIPISKQINDVFLPLIESPEFREFQRRVVLERFASTWPDPSETPTPTVATYGSRQLSTEATLQFLLAWISLANMAITEEGDRHLLESVVLGMLLTVLTWCVFAAAD